LAGRRGGRRRPSYVRGWHGRPAFVAGPARDRVSQMSPASTPTGRPQFSGRSVQFLFRRPPSTGRQSGAPPSSTHSHPFVARVGQAPRPSLHPPTASRGAAGAPPGGAHPAPTPPAPPASSGRVGGAGPSGIHSCGPAARALEVPAAPPSPPVRPARQRAEGEGQLAVPHVANLHGGHMCDATAVLSAGHHSWSDAVQTYTVRNLALLLLPGRPDVSG